MILSRYTLPVLLSIASACAFAQATPPPKDETAPSAASSPHQRETTTTEAEEAPANQSAEPAASSSPHQREATKTGTETRTAEQDRMMKDCISKQQEKDSSMSKDQAKKACAEQMKTRQRTRG